MVGQRYPGCPTDACELGYDCHVAGSCQAVVAEADANCPFAACEDEFECGLAGVCLHQDTDL